MVERGKLIQRPVQEQRRRIVPFKQHEPRAVGNAASIPQSQSSTAPYHRQAVTEPDRHREAQEPSDNDKRLSMTTMRHRLSCLRCS